MLFEEDNIEDVNAKLSKNNLNGFIRGTILWIICKEKSIYGYEIINVVNEIFEKPIERKNMKGVSSSKIYPILHEMVEKKLITFKIEDHEGREVKYYKITEKGKNILKTRKKRIKEIMDKNELFKEFIRYMFL